HPGRQGRNAVSAQQKGRHRLVDAALDGPSIVVNGHSQLAQRMQHRQAQRDLLEGTGLDASNEYRVGLPLAESGHLYPRLRAFQVDPAVRQARESTLHAQRKKSALQLAAMPAGLVGQDRNAQRHVAGARRCTPNDWAISSSFRLPPRKVRPDATWVT